MTKKDHKDKEKEKEKERERDKDKDTRATVRGHAAIEAASDPELEADESLIERIEALHEIFPPSFKQKVAKAVDTVSWSVRQLKKQRATLSLSC